MIVLVDMSRVFLCRDGPPKNVTDVKKIEPMENQPYSYPSYELWMKHYDNQWEAGLSWTLCFTQGGGDIQPYLPPLIIILNQQQTN